MSNEKRIRHVISRTIISRLISMLFCKKKQTSYGIVIIYSPWGWGEHVRNSVGDDCSPPFALKTMRSLHPSLGNSYFLIPWGWFFFYLLMLLVTPLALGRLIEENGAFSSKQGIWYHSLPLQLSLKVNALFYSRSNFSTQGWRRIQNLARKKVSRVCSAVRGFLWSYRFVPTWLIVLLVSEGKWIKTKTIIH